MTLGRTTDVPRFYGDRYSRDVLCGTVGRNKGHEFQFGVTHRFVPSSTPERDWGRPSTGFVAAYARVNLSEDLVHATSFISPRPTPISATSMP